MVLFDATILAGLRKTQEDHMQDTCVIYHVTEKTKNSRGESVKTFAEGVTSICGVNMQPEASNNGESFVTVMTDVVLRLPHGTEVKPGDEIEITKRYGEDIEPQRYEVDRYVNEGPSGNRAYLKVSAVK